MLRPLWQSIEISSIEPHSHLVGLSGVGTPHLIGDLCNEILQPQGINHEVPPEVCIPHCLRHLFKYPLVEAIRFYRLLTYLIFRILVLESQIRLELERVMLVDDGNEDVVHIVKDAEGVCLHLEGVCVLALGDREGCLLLRLLCQGLPQIDWSEVIAIYD